MESLRPLSRGDVGFQKPAVYRGDVSVFSIQSGAGVVGDGVGVDADVDEDAVLSTFSSVLGVLTRLRKRGLGVSINPWL